MALSDLTDVFDIEDIPARFCIGAPAPIVLIARKPLSNMRWDSTVATAIACELGSRAMILIRGLAPMDPHATAEVANVLFAGQPTFDTGEHPHAGDGALYRPVEFAHEETLLWHHENTFNRTWPLSMMFVCAIPAAEGGATMLADSRLVYASMPADVIAPLARHGIRYERRCDGHVGRTWQQIYGTSDQETARALASTNDEDLVFADDGTAWIHAVRASFYDVPHGTSWFNQLLHWHPRALPAELRDMVHNGLMSTFRTCTVGNGDPIEPAAIDALFDAHRAVEYCVRWQTGDILLIDNAVVAHGRRPYKGRREHFVRMAGIGQAPTPHRFPAPGTGR